jgi:hypothetical protein
VLHLLCQGIEIVLKSLLLFTDYDAHTKLSAHQRGGGWRERYRTIVIAGGCQMPSPGGKIEGGSAFGQ